MKCKGEISGSCHSTYPLCCRVRAPAGCGMNTPTPALSPARDSLPIPLPVGESTSSTPAHQRAGKFRGVLGEKSEHTEYFCAGW